MAQKTKDIVEEMIEKIQSGQYIEMDTSLRHIVNARIAEMICVGDKVRIVRSNKVGIVTKKIIYDREHQDWYSPLGYTAIQVSVNGCKHSYSGRSLQIMEKKQSNTGVNRDVAVESIENSCYLNSCKCPVCGKSMTRGTGEETRYCQKCGQKLHLRAFTKEEIRQAVFDRRMDDYED